MPGQIITPTLGVGLLDNQYQASETWDDTVLYPARWSYRRRSLRSTWDQNQWNSLWPIGGFMSGDPTLQMTIVGNDYSNEVCFGYGGNFEAPSNIGSGTQSTKFIKGTTLDSTGAVLANAIVKPYVTATDVEDGPAVTSAADGTYAAGVYTPGAHYVVAYKSGSPDVAGTSVNTLSPTNIDGT